MLSMWPLIQKKDQIVDLAPSESYEVDDIIIFLESKRLVAHRIIYKSPFKQGAYITKGDNNRVSDRPVRQSKILGKALTIRRDNRVIKIEPIYKKQANNYLKALSEFEAAAKSEKLKYIILKGIPIYKKYLGTYPRHFIFDADILIYPKDLDKLIKILQKLKFNLNIPSKDAKEFSAIKRMDDLPTSLDIHLEPAIAFSQFPSFNKLLPQIDDLTQEIWITCRNRLLSPNHQFVYLLLHALHHAYAGTSRWDMLNKLRNHALTNSATCIKIIKHLRISSLVYGPLVFLEKYYGKSKTTTQIIKSINPPNRVKFITKITTTFMKPWTHHHHYLNRLELLAYLFILSPLAVKSKFKILFYSITSIDSKVFTKWAKSRLA